MSTSVKLTNTLSSCVTSPYLLQHAHNPVHWMAWGQHAHQLARQLHRPIFLSIGYTSCHWCHVMERESFENEEIASMLNQYFINIKVDKEERPDLDRLHMTYVQATTGSGGWPLSVFLTPDLKPFVGGTYFPPEEKYGQTGFKTLIQRVYQVWTEDARTVEMKASHIFNMLKSSLVGQHDGGVGGGEARASPTGPLGDVGRRLFRQLSQRFNQEYGGFSDAPLFPRPSELQCLLALASTPLLGSAADTSRSVHMVLHTLRKMAQGGIHDHIGGGFSRYSVDECWHVPHFEKMLYDNAQLLLAYAAAYQTCRDPYFASIGVDIFNYIGRDLMHASGMFYSAQDADSRSGFDSAESTEGAYYVWSRGEIVQQLGAGLAADIVCFHYNIMEGGNCNLSLRSDPHGEFRGVSIPIELGPDPIGQTAGHFRRDREEIVHILQDAKRTLLEHRRKTRPAPITDDKIIAAWNAMAVSACAQSHCAFVVGQHEHDASERPDFLQAAVRAIASIEQDMFVTDPDSGAKRLLRSVRYVDGKPVAGPAGFADDYAWMIKAYLDLYRATADHRYVQRAVQLQDAMDIKFKKGNSYLTSDPHDDPSVLIQIAEVNDGAEPSSNSVAFGNLCNLGNLLGAHQGAKYAAMAKSVVAIMFVFNQRDRSIWNWVEPTASDVPNAMPFMLGNAVTVGSPDRLIKVVITGEHQTELVQRFRRAIFSRYLPALSLTQITSQDAYHYFATINDSVRSMKDDGVPKLLLCVGLRCHPAITQPDHLDKILDSLQEH